MTTQTPITTIPSRFAGLPGLAHGGYVAGLVAGALDGAAADVRLRRPIPVDAPLALERTGPDTAELRDGETVLATGRDAELAIEVPEPVTLEDARRASRDFPGFDRHVFPHCLVCGTEHPQGLGIHPGPVRGRELVAAPWTPDVAFADEAGHVAPEFAWAALDCPQLWALILDAGTDSGERVVTSSLAAHVHRPIVAGEPHVVLAWSEPRAARGPVAGAAVFTPGGELAVAGRQTTASVTGWGVPLGRDHWTDLLSDHHHDHDGSTR